MTSNDAGVLGRHSQIVDGDVDTFRVHASGLLTPHRITLADAGGPEVHGDVRAAAIGDLTLIYLELGTPVDVDILEPIDYYDVIFAVGGRSDVRLPDGGTATIDGGNGVVLSPGMRAGMRMSADYRQLHLRIERETVNRRLAGLLGRPVGSMVRFDAALDLTDRRVASWYQTIRLAVRDVDEGLAAHPLAAASWQDHLLTGLLVAQSNSYRGRLDDVASGRPSRRVVRRVVEYCDEHLAEPITLADLASHAGMSGRSLQRLFADELGTSPSEYLRGRRLDRVRADLLADGPATSVTDVAYRWGFTHLSRFAAAYREKYGEPPSSTLRRATGR